MTKEGKVENITFVKHIWILHILLEWMKGIEVENFILKN